MLNSVIISFIIKSMCTLLKFQSIVIPCGLISSLHGPVVGSRHDSYLLGVSQIVPDLEALNIRDRHGNLFALYGDPAYPHKEVLQVGYKGVNLSQAQKEFNTAMSKVKKNNLIC